MIDRSGQQFGSYRLLDLEGRGNFAEVYLGEHTHRETRVAIKILHTTLSDEEIVSFRTEARAIAKLEHPHIARLIEFGTREYVPFLAIEYAPHGSLRKLHPRGSQVPLSTIISYVKQIAQALQYAHDQHIIHRDLKPENVLLNQQRMLLLSDFNLTTLTRSITMSTHELAGTATYMAPEQFQNKVHPTTDQYALGVMVYEWLCGRRPFHGTMKELASHHVFAPPPPLREQLPTLPPEVEQVVQRAMEKSPARRFSTISEFAEALEQASLVVDAETPQLTYRDGRADTIRQSTSSFPRVSKDDVPIYSITSSISRIGKDNGHSSTSAIPRIEREDGRLHSPVETHTAANEPLLTSEQSELSEEAEEAEAVKRPEKQARRRRPASMKRRFIITGLATIGLAGIGTLGVVEANSLLKRLNLLSLLRPMSTPVSTARQPVPTPSPTPAYTPIPLGTRVALYHGHQKAVQAVAWSTDGTHIASASEDQTVQIWSPVTGDHLLTYKGHNAPVTALAWSPDGSRVASASDDKTVQIWDALSGTTIFTYKGHTDSVTALAWSPNGSRIASASEDQTVQIWSENANSNIFIYKGHNAAVTALAWSPNGSRIVSASADKTAQVWNASDGSHPLIYSKHLDRLTSVTWSPDGKHIASASQDKTVQVWETTYGSNVLTYTGHSDIVWSTAWSPDGSRIASASADKTVQIWSATDSLHIFTYNKHSDSVQSVAWSPDNSLIASASRDQSVRVWGAGSAA